MYYNVFEGSDMYVNMVKGVVKVLCCFIICSTVLGCVYVLFKQVLHICLLLFFNVCWLPSGEMLSSLPWAPLTMRAPFHMDPFGFWLSSK